MSDLDLKTWFGGEQKRFCLHWPAFIIAFAIGLFYVYISAPPRHVVVKFPTPYNAGKVIYQDDAETCFKYKAQELQCPSDKKKILKQPVFVDEKETIPK